MNETEKSLRLLRLAVVFLSALTLVSLVVAGLALHQARQDRDASWNQNTLRSFMAALWESEHPRPPTGTPQEEEYDANYAHHARTVEETYKRMMSR